MLSSPASGIEVDLAISIASSSVATGCSASSIS
jgi:hypothetical protein